MSNSKEEKEDDIPPALGRAVRAMSTTMMAKVASRGFNDMTPAFANAFVFWMLATRATICASPSIHAPPCSALLS